MENFRPVGYLRVVLWLESSANQHLRHAFPQSLQSLLQLQEAHYESTGLSPMEFAVLLTEFLMKNIGSNSESFQTMAGWLEEIGEAWQKHKQPLTMAISSWLAQERPVVQTTYVIFSGDTARDAIPASREAFDAMVASDSITFRCD